MERGYPQATSQHDRPGHHDDAGTATDDPATQDTGRDAHACIGDNPTERLATALRDAIMDDRGAEDGPRLPVPAPDHAPGGMELAATVLWSRFLRFDVADPRWADRDRFVLSSGRFLPLLRALLRLTGHGSIPSGCAFGQHPAIETAAGPPGQGFATAVGMAMAERALAGRFGRTLVDHRTWVLACETDLAAGVSMEAAALAGGMRLDKLVVLFDAVPAVESGQTLAGPDTMTRFAACGWAVRRVASRDPEAIAAAIAGALRVRRPTLIACQQTPVPPAASPDREPGQPARLRPVQPQPQPEPEQIWHDCGQRGVGIRRGWLRRLARHRLRPEFDRTTSARLPSGWEQGWQRGWREATGPATLDAGRHGLALLCGLLPETTTLHSTAGATLLDRLADAEGADGLAERPVRHVSCGVQEHGMAALLNGLSLHGGSRPVLCASFVSIDRMRPALRLAALMGQPVIYLLTGDGLALGEDAAGWQPVEQLASLRAMPEVAVFRPADAAEVVACWELALRHDTGPSLIALSPRPPPGGDIDAGGRRAGRPAAPDVAPPDARRRGCARGGYLLAGPPASRQATLIATGPEVAIALQAQVLLESKGIAVAVVSLPCWELFSAQPASYRAQILGEAPRIGIEAASGFGWERWLGPDGIFIGMDGFGAAASADTLYRQFGITPEAIAARVRRHLGITSH